MAKTLLFSMCACLLLVSDSEPGPLKQNAIQTPNWNAKHGDPTNHLYGKLPVDPIRPLLEALNVTLRRLQDLGFSTYDEVVKLLPGNKSKDTANGAVSKTIGSDNALAQLFSGIANVLLDHILYLCFGGKKPMYQDKKTFNKNDINKLISDIFGNDYGLIDWQGDYLTKNFAGKSAKVDGNKTLD